MKFLIFLLCFFADCIVSLLVFCTFVIVWVFMELRIFMIRVVSGSNKVPVSVIPVFVQITSTVVTCYIVI